MRIAQVAPLFESVPPRLYGGTERVVSYLTEELVRLGHEVTLFASGDSETAARLVPGCPKALWRDDRVQQQLPHHVRLMELVFQDVSRFDIINFHNEYLHFPLLRRHPFPHVTTLHGNLCPTDIGPVLEHYPDFPLVSISDSQRRPLPNANWVATVHHGLPLDLCRLEERPGDYLAFLGRVAPEKGLDHAIAIARAAGMLLKVGARLCPTERAYYHREVEPLLRESRDFVEFLGEVGGETKHELLRKARALLFPITWPEPFGLVMIEAMACGTPVIAFRQGSVPEVVVEGQTGFIVDDVAGAMAALGRIDAFDRRACRRVFEERFSAARMAQDYLATYRRTMQDAERVHAGQSAVLEMRPASARQAPSRGGRQGWAG